jgi:DNA-binding FadR family transcriptional regulator
METTAQKGGTRRNLVAELVGALEAEIADGTFQPGDKLPSGARLTERFGVSRTVVREAIAGLRADGLVAPRQGAGVFVLDRPEEPEKPFHIVDYERISSVIEMLELRVAVEMEAASLAAQRRSPQQEEAIFEGASEMRRCLESGASTKEADQRFHLAVADATNNPRFREFLEILGLSMIPRAALAVTESRGDPAYIEMISGEHERIATAISAGDAVAAREAMQAHLRNSMSRYRDLIRR